eukprot:8667033-Pyramimonas_sp.AAC.1
MVLRMMRMMMTILMMMVMMMTMMMMMTILMMIRTPPRGQSFVFRKQRTAGSGRTSDTGP